MRRDMDMLMCGRLGGRWTVWLLLAIVMPVKGDVYNSSECGTMEGQIIKVDMSKLCNRDYKVHSAVALFPAAHEYSVIPEGMNCSVTFLAPADHQLAATMYKVTTETGTNKTCSKNRLDIYDGESAITGNRLSNSTGICGCDLPKEVYKSTNGSLTATFKTENGTTQHGTFDVVISAIRKDVHNVTSCPGQFECKKSRKCIDKNEVCDGKANCADRSDETGCKKRPPKHEKLPPIWLWVLIGIGALCAVMFLIIAILMCYWYCCKQGYRRLP